MIPDFTEIFQPAASLACRSVRAPFTDPVRLMRRLGIDRGAWPVLLDSAGGDPRLCRYSLLAWDPRLRLTVSGGQASLSSPDGRAAAPESDPFGLLRELLKAAAPRQSPAANELGLPLTGGAFGLVSYDANRYIERLPRQAADDLGFPELSFIFPRRLLVHDHHQGAAHIFVEDGGTADLDVIEAALREQPPSRPPWPGGRQPDGSAAAGSNLNQRQFEEMVRQAREYIYAGDVFQANLSRRLEMEYAGDSLELYEALRQVNPSPFAGYLELGGFTVISSSPERLVQLDGRRAQTRPIAGTRRRGADFNEDDSLTQELNLDPKERAEHIMLVDLERNDLGRVCDYGSVRVSELMVNEFYSHVIHIVSNVEGELHQSRDAIDLLKAMFPGGTITGCPKVRCMEIIDELEPVRRGPYTGSFGYIGYNGNMDMNIIIRTLLRRGDRVFAQAGAGIVADSDPEREYHETARKAEAMVRAVELAQKQVSSSGSGIPR